MKLTTLATATAAIALLGGAAQAQQPQPGPTAGSVTGDWNGAHAPTDDKQYQEKTTVTTGSPPATTSMPSASATTAAGSVTSDTAASTDANASTDVTAGSGAATGASADASFTSTTVTNGPVPDTRENRAKYGQPMSRAGKMTAARGN